jgi:formylglycine-generating enzyme required for sulfatase activity
MSNLDIVPREESERRLAAILVADVVGYSRLIGWKAWQSRGAFTSPEKLTTKVRDRPFAFDDLGMKAVKNIARLVRVYRVRPGEVTRTSARAAQWFPPSWRLRAAAGSFIGLAIVVAALVLLLPATLKKTTSSVTQPIPATETPLGSDEMSAWAKIKSSDKIDELASYLDRFPNSRYSEYIRHRLNALRSHLGTTRFRDCIGCPEMVVIPAGSFTMGIPQNEVDRDGIPLGIGAPLHSVRIARPFALGEFLVTRKQYATFAEETGQAGTGCYALPVDGISWKYYAARSWRDSGFTQADDHPVLCVSWDDALTYVSWLSGRSGQTYRLPTEAEWEYAGRAGGTSGRYFGDAPICEFANVRDQSKKQLYSTGRFFECNGGFPNTSPVGSFPPNGFGLYDVLGNAWEWVCAVTRRRFPVGASPTRRFAPAGSNRSRHGGDEMSEAFG